MVDYIGGAHWQSMTFTVLRLSQLAHVMVIRSERDSLLALAVASNRALLAAVSLTVALQLAILYSRPLSRVFRTTPLSAAELAACVAIASAVFVAVELEKWFIRRGALYRSSQCSMRRTDGVPVILQRAMAIAHPDPNVPWDSTSITSHLKSSPKRHARSRA